jgi:hypothetical protein
LATVVAILSSDCRAQPKIEILYEGTGLAAICSDRTAIVATPHPSADINARLTIEMERLIVETNGPILRQNAVLRPHGIDPLVACFGDYVALDLGTLSGHTFLDLYRWPAQATIGPTLVAVGADVGAIAPGYAFASPYPTETLPQRRARLPAPEFIMLPDHQVDVPDSMVRAGTSRDGAPLLLGVYGSRREGGRRLTVVQLGEDPAKFRRIALKLDGVSESLMMASLGSLNARPLLNFSYALNEDAKSYLIIGAATCDELHDIADESIRCRPLIRLRRPLPSGPWSVAESFSDRSLIAIPEPGTRALLALVDSLEGRSTCLSTHRLGGSLDIADPPACAASVEGHPVQMGAVADGEALLLVADGGPDGTRRLLRIRGL